MAVTNAGLAGLSSDDRQAVESWLFEFDRDWHEGRLAEHVRKLPPHGSPLRFVALVEMVKIDLERQWQQGRQPCVEGFLRCYPELGTIDSVPADLIAKEYEVRHQFSASPQLSTFMKRFPRQADELRPLLEQSKKSSAPSRASLKSKETPRSNSPLQGTAPGSGVGADLPERFGRYLIRRRLGQGGMGSVYLARDTELDRDVALKVPHLSTADGPELLERFYREARAAATLQHPYICPVHDVGQVDKVPYLTMSYIEGQPLSKIIEQGKPLSPRSIAELVRKLALALQEAHAKGIVHRDLKPSNIMINKRGEPVIMDFGLVLRVDNAEARLTKSGSTLGTPAYMPPEQVRGATTEMGPACDIYSLGVILYELLSGHLPFDGPYMVVCAQILTQEAPPPSNHQPDVDPKLEAICLKAMAKKTAERYASMADLAAALDGYLQQQRKPAEAKPGEGATALPRPVGRDASHPQRRTGWYAVLVNMTAAGAAWKRRGLFAASLLVALLVLGYFFGGTVIRFATNKGELVIETDDPNIEVTMTIKSGDVTIHDKVKDRRFVLTAGDYDVEVREVGDGGVRFRTKKLSITRGRKETFNAKLVRPPEPLPAKSERPAAPYAIAGTRWVGTYFRVGALPGETKQTYASDQVIIIKEREGSKLVLESWHDKETRGLLFEATLDEEGNVKTKFIKIIRGAFPPVTSGSEGPFGRIEGKNWKHKSTIDGIHREFDVILQEVKADVTGTAKKSPQKRPRPNDFKSGSIRVTNDRKEGIEVRLYHADRERPEIIWGTWRVAAGESTILKTPDDSPATIGSNWEIDIKYDDGTFSQRCYIDEVCALEAPFDVQVSNVPR